MNPGHEHTNCVSERAVSTNLYNGDESPISTNSLVFSSVIPSRAHCSAFRRFSLANSSIEMVQITTLFESRRRSAVSRLTGQEKRVQSCYLHDAEARDVDPVPEVVPRAVLRTVYERRHDTAQMPKLRQGNAQTPRTRRKEGRRTRPSFHTQ